MKRYVLVLLVACSSSPSPQVADAPGGVQTTETGLVDTSTPVDAGPSSSRQTKRPKGTTAAANGYLEYLPPDYGTGASPLMVFWHGKDENGAGTAVALDAVAKHGPPHLIATDAWPNTRPFVVLSPQHTYSLNNSDCPTADEIHNFINYALASYQVDSNHVYLTGLSCGAIGSWNYMGKYVDEVQLAAFVPISGNGGPAWTKQGCDLGKVAIWAFHGDQDGTVPIAGDTTAMTNLASCSNAQENIFTVYPGVGHNAWTRTYDLSAGHDIYTWMLSKTRVP